MLALLRQVRADSGLSQRDVAARLKCQHSWVAKVELGERRLDVIEFVRLAHALGTDPVELLKVVASRIR